MESIIIAISFGYVLILVEGFLPGGIFGLAGAICLFIASYFAYLEFGGFLAPILTFLISSIGGLLIVFLEFKWLSKSKFGNSFFLRSKTDGTSNEERPSVEIIGREGKALTEHKPEGIVSINGKNYDSYCEDGLLHKGKSIVVIGLDDFRIRVKKIN